MKIHQRDSTRIQKNMKNQMTKKPARLRETKEKIAYTPSLIPRIFIMSRKIDQGLVCALSIPNWTNQNEKKLLQYLRFHYLWMSHINHSGINLQSFHLLLATIAPFHSWVSSWPKNSPPNKLHHCGRKPKKSPTKQGPQPKEPWRQVTTKTNRKTCDA